MQAHRNKVSPTAKFVSSRCPALAHSATTCGQQVVHPVQDSFDKLFVELVVDGKVVRHAINLQIAGLSRVHLVDSLDDGFAVCPAHDRVGFPSNYQHRHADSLPHFAEIQGFQLLIERGWTSVLAISCVVPQIFPFWMLRDDLARGHSFCQIQGIEFSKTLYVVVDVSGGFLFRDQPPPFQLPHVFIPRSSPRASRDISAYSVMVGSQGRESPAVTQTNYEHTI